MACDFEQCSALQERQRHASVRLCNIAQACCIAFLRMSQRLPDVQRYFQAGECCDLPSAMSATNCAFCFASAGFSVGILRLECLLRQKQTGLQSALSVLAGSRLHLDACDQAQVSRGVPFCGHQQETGVHHTSRGKRFAGFVPPTQLLAVGFVSHSLKFEEDHTWIAESFKPCPFDQLAAKTI